MVLGKDFLFKSTLGHCDYLYFKLMYVFWNAVVLKAATGTKFIICTYQSEAEGFKIPGGIRMFFAKMSEACNAKTFKFTICINLVLFWFFTLVLSAEYSTCQSHHVVILLFSASQRIAFSA